jgi:hypothetical protein
MRAKKILMRLRCFMRILFLAFVFLSQSIYAAENTWNINENKPHPDVVMGSLVEYDPDAEFWMATVAMAAEYYGDRLRVTLVVNEWFGVEPAPECKGTKIGEPVDKGMDLHKFNDTWIKMKQFCVAFEREGSPRMTDYHMILTPQTYSDVLKLVDLFKKSNEVLYDNKMKFTAKNFIKTYNIYSQRLGI